MGEVCSLLLVLPPPNKGLVALSVAPEGWEMAQPLFYIKSLATFELKAFLLSAIANDSAAV